MRGLRPPAGFTLIELMVAVAIVATLATIIYPSYVDHVRRGRIAAALGELSAMQVRLEQYYQDNGSYGSSAADCGVPVPAAAAFTFSCSWGAGGTSQSFLVRAAGDADAGMTGYVYTVDDRDEQRTVEFAGSAVGAACWLQKKGETC